MPPGKPFRFKQFSVQDNSCAMKIGTDAVLLGTWADIKNAKKVLDIGTGCGIIALIIAQRSTALIDAIDIDRDSIYEAEFNFDSSNWDNRLSAQNYSLQHFSKAGENKYDLIVSNPPFFTNSQLPPKNSKAISKHDISLTHNELLAAIPRLLKPEGKFCTVLPFTAINSFKEKATIENLYCNNQLSVIPVEGKIPNRALLEFSFQSQARSKESDLCIRNKNKSYTEDYKKLTKDFYLKF